MQFIVYSADQGWVPRDVLEFIIQCSAGWSLTDSTRGLPLATFVMGDGITVSLTSGYSWLCQRL